MNCNRRRAVVGALTAGVALARASARNMPNTMHADGHPRPRLDGTIHFDAPTREAAAQDFGHLLHHLPQAVVQPTSPRDIAATLRWAAARRLKVAPRGAGHSVFGRSQARDGIVLDMTRLRSVHDVQPDRVIVDAGATWRDVLAATLPRGLMPPALPDYLDLSVGGTLVVGGVGAGITRHGVSADNVLELDVVSGSGRVLHSSREHEAELFDAVRAGLGQVAVITRATLRLVAAPRHIRRFVLVYADLRALLADQRRLTADGRFDSVQGAIVATPGGAWTFRLDAAKGFDAQPPDDDALLAGLADQRSMATRTTLPCIDHLGRLGALEQALRANGQWWHPHPWLTTFVGDDAVEDVVGAELAQLAGADLGPFGQVVLSPFVSRAVACPLLRLPAGERCWAFNLIRVPASARIADAEPLVAANRRVYERLAAHGGTLYPVSAFTMTRDDWRRHFGPAFSALAAAKHTFDPGAVLTPGYEVF
jgi:cytokinin dehydrogenase